VREVRFGAEDGVRVEARVMRWWILFSSEPVLLEERNMSPMLEPSLLEERLLETRE
jgi:hypothetical protein